MADAYTAAVLNGMTKTVYADEDINLTIEEDSISGLTKFAPSGMKLGNIFEQPVWMTQEHGHTAKEGSARAMHALNSPIAAETAVAQVRGSEYTLTMGLPYGMISSMLSADGAEAKRRAFKSLVQVARENGRKASVFIRDYQFLYGGLEATSAAVGAEGLGIIDSQSGSGTTRSLVITAASWAPGLWSGAKNRELDGCATAATTVLNSNAAVVVTAVNHSTRTLSVSGNATDLDALVATTRLFPRGFITNEAAGLVRVLKNTGSLHNINAATYPEWNGTATTTTGALTWEKVIRSMSRVFDFGNTGEYILLTSNGAWIDMMTDLSAIRTFAEKAGGKLEQGANGLVFHGPNDTRIKVRGSSMVKQGYAIGFMPSEVVRVGTQDDQDSVNGSDNSAIFFDKPGYNGVEMRRYWNQSPFCARPTSLFLISGITNKVA